MSQPEPHERKQKMNLRLPSEQANFLTQLAQKRGFVNPRGGYDESKAVSVIIESYRLLGLQTSEECRPEMCKDCPQYGGVNDEGVLDIIKKSVTDRVSFEFKPLAVAKACSEKPFNTPVEKKSREMLESEIERLKPYQLKCAKQKEQLNSIRPEIERIRAELQTKRTKFDEISEGLRIFTDDNLHLKGENAELKNGLLRETEKVALLEHDNDYLRSEVKDLSSDTLAEKISFQNVQLGTLRTQIEDYKGEIEKLEALNTHKNATLNEVVLKVSKMLREFKQFLPQSVDSYALKDYLQSLQKKIDDFEGYINTVSA
jgi:hypothetical protein